MSEKFEYSRKGAQITLDKISSWEELNAATLEEADEKFKQKTKEHWEDFAVSGVLAFDRETGERVLKPFTDLDGNCALGILKQAGIDTSKLKYVKPGESVKGSINLDTGDQFGVVYNEDTYTAYFDHHKKGAKEVTSTTEIIYKTMVDLGMIEKSEELDKMVDFVTKIDNRQYPPEEFLRSAKTLLGLQRSLRFNQLIDYFKDHKSSTEELTLEELDKYGLKEVSGKQQETIDEAMETLKRMEKEGKIINTKYGKIVINENNELKVGASAAYVKYDGIINITPGKSFALTFKEKSIDEEELKQKLGDKFQGKVIREKMWIYNEKEPLRLGLEDIISVLNAEHKGDIQNQQIEGLREPIEQLLSQLEESISKGEYKIIIGDDVSGRIPTLIFNRVIKSIYKDKGYPAPQTIFLAGSRMLEQNKAFEKIKRISKHLKFSLGPDKTIVEKAIQKVGAKGKGLKALIVTESIETGRTLSFVASALRNKGVAYDIATITINTPDIHNINRLEKEFGGPVFFSHKYYGIYTIDKKVSGIEKDYDNILSKKIPGNQLITNQSRDDVINLSNYLIDWYKKKFS